MVFPPELLDFVSAQLWQGFVVFIRVGALVALLPAFGERSLPARVRLVVAGAFTLIIAPAVDIDAAAISLPAAVLSEGIVGVSLGLGVRLFIMALQTAGAIAAQSTSLSQILGGAAVEPLAAIGYVLMIGAIALAVMADLHVKAAALVIFSYEVLPAGVFVTGADLSAWGVDQIRRAFSLAFTLAAPFVLISMLYNLCLGVINKAMPQLMVAFVGAPVITAGGLLVLCLASPIILTVWMQALDGFLAAPFEAVP